MKIIVKARWVSSRIYLASTLHVILAVLEQKVCSELFVLVT
jgi:hypothetical protein